ncbi:unnamed protein product [Peniophora sp. CBMAI 1063]|nr:unnamed protein product [Peniophora sp. CBMAI 1063]
MGDSFPSADHEASNSTPDQPPESPATRVSSQTHKAVPNEAPSKPRKPKPITVHHGYRYSNRSRRLRADKKVGEAEAKRRKELVRESVEGFKEDLRELNRQRDKERREQEAPREAEKRRQEAEQRWKEADQRAQESERRWREEEQQWQEAKQRRKEAAQQQRAWTERFTNALEDYVLWSQEKDSRRWRDAWARYSAQGASLPQRLDFTTIVWPVLDPPTCSPPQMSDGPPIINGLTREKLMEFLLSPEHSVGVNSRARIQAALLRWHPDKMARVLEIVVEKDRTTVEEGVKIVAGELATMLRQVSEARRM